MENLRRRLIVLLGLIALASAPMAFAGETSYDGDESSGARTTRDGNASRTGNDVDGNSDTSPDFETVDADADGEGGTSPVEDPSVDEDLDCDDDECHGLY